MNAYMGRELELFVKSMGCGALLVLLYDGIRILRIRCLVLGNRAFLQRICIYFGKKVAFLFTKSYNFFTCKNAQILVKNA